MVRDVLSRIQDHTQLLLALGAIAHAQWKEALQLLACVVATPTGRYNHCLLQCQVGVVMGGASGWLEWRGKHLGGREEVRRQLAEARSQLTHSRYIYLLTTVAMAIYPIIYTQWQNGALYCYGHCYAESLA